jgi:hypothetical protein
MRHLVHLQILMFFANFGELRHGEVRRVPLPRTPVNRALPESLSRDEVIMEVLGGPQAPVGKEAPWL